MTGPSLTWRGKLGWIGFFLVGIVLFLSSFFLVAPLGVVTMFVVGVLVFAQVAFTAGLIHYPYRNFRGPGPNVRSLDAPEQGEYEQLCADSEAAVRGVWVTDDLRHAYGFAQLLGVIPGNRHLFVDVAFFDLYTPDERRAVVVRESRLATSYYFYFAQTLPVLVVLVYYGIELLAVGSIVISRWPFVPELLALLVLVGGLWTTRRKVYRADEFAAEQTSPEGVVNALATFADENRDSDAEWIYIKLVSLFWTRPSPDKRIDWIRKRFDVEESTVEEYTAEE
jgi:hypothetical protein